MSSYSDIIIPTDLWCVIGSKLDSFRDRLHFRAVCKSWRSLLAPLPHPPCLLLDESVGQDETPPCRHFMCLGKQQVHKLDLPEIRRVRCIGSVGSWLLTVDNVDKKLCLTNLFSGVQTHLVPDDRLTEEIRSCGFRKIVLSSPVCDAESCTAVAFYDGSFSLACARPGDTSWTNFPHDYYDGPGCIKDIIFHRQQFYLVDIKNNLMVWDIGNNLHPPTLLTIKDDGEDDDNSDTDDDDDNVVLDDDGNVVITGHHFDYCLVEWLGELLVIHFRSPFIETDYWITHGHTDRIIVYMLDRTSMKLTKLNSFGEHSLFVGNKSTCVSVLASDYFGLVKKNCIYFIEISEPTEHIRVGFDVRVYDMEDKSISTYYKDLPGRDWRSLPVWIVPSPNKQ